MRAEYKGTVKWQTGNPPKTGRYLSSKNGYVAEHRFYKVGSKTYWELNDESESGGYIKIDTMDAWAYLPEPYCNN